eukprot:gene19787-23664_t
MNGGEVAEEAGGIAVLELDNEGDEFEVAFAEGEAARGGEDVMVQEQQQEEEEDFAVAQQIVPEEEEEAEDFAVAQQMGPEEEEDHAIAQQMEPEDGGQEGLPLNPESWEQSFTVAPSTQPEKDEEDLSVEPSVQEAEEGGNPDEDFEVATEMHPAEDDTSAQCPMSAQPEMEEDAKEPDEEPADAARGGGMPQHDVASILHEGEDDEDMGLDDDDDEHIEPVGREERAGGRDADGVQAAAASDGGHAEEAEALATAAEKGPGDMEGAAPGDKDGPPSRDADGGIHQDSTRAATGPWKGPLVCCQRQVTRELMECTQSY